jgi:hypothetical protein
MFDPLYNPSSLRPFLKGLTVMTAVVLGAITVASFLVSVSTTALKPLPKSLSITLRFRPAIRRRSINAAAPARRASAVPNSPVTASVRSSDWARRVERGRSVDYSVVALDSLPVLRSFGVVLAFDTRFPRGTTYLMDLATGVFWTGAVPAHRIVRELEGVTAADIESAKRQAEAELGNTVRVFALYPADLYLALRGYADEALRNSGVAPASVEAVKVRLRLTGPRQFTVALEK